MTVCRSFGCLDINLSQSVNLKFNKLLSYFTSTSTVHRLPAISLGDVHVTQVLVLNPLYLLDGSQSHTPN